MKFERAADITECGETLQRYLYKLESWAIIKRKKFNTSKCWILQINIQQS